ncbi:Major facilitator superfamily domain general substrate transporter [Penicillium expansum]|nr:Major facilitator superfamily domain general substrate transporter [Penicillium expansum]
MEIDKKTPVDDTINEKDVQIGTITELDEGEVFLRQHGFNQEAIQALLDDEPRNKALVRKVDLVLLPLLSGTYMLQYIDKSALAYSALAGQYLLFCAYLVAEYPWNILAQKTKLAKVVSGNVIAWGAMLMITAACSSFTGMAICRFLLGVFEAPITPCFMLMIGMWYTRAQQPFRAGVFYSCNGLGAMVGGILTYGIGQIDTIAVWRAIYLILGGITLVWGVVMLLFLPDDVISSKSFTLDEKALLIGRARLGQTGIMNHKIKWYQIREALIDPQVWILFFFTLLNEVVNGGIASFGKLIIKGLTDDSATAVALGIPFGGFQIFYVLGGTYLASRIRNFRTVVMFIYLLPTILGASLLWKLDHKTYKVGVLFGYYIIGAYVCSLVLALQMPATNLGGYTKRTTSVALVFLAYFKLILACSSAQAALAVLLRFVLARRNKQRDAAAAAVGQLESSTDQSAGADLTDFENPNFRYVL